MTGLRITAGSLRGRKVPVPPSDVRPTSTKARQAFFDIIGPAINGARFLDLFAGSGIFSLEAISRGAGSAIAIDHSTRSAQQIERLAREWSLPIRAIKSDVRTAIGSLPRSEPVDVVYCDPPYDFAGHRDLLEEIDRAAPLSSRAIVAMEHRSDRNELAETSTNRIRFRKTARYGEVAISIFDALEPTEEEQAEP